MIYEYGIGIHSIPTPNENPRQNPPKITPPKPPGLEVGVLRHQVQVASVSTFLEFWAQYLFTV